MNEKPTIRDIEAILECHRREKGRDKKPHPSLPDATPTTQARPSEPPKAVSIDQRKVSERKRNKPLDTTDTPESRTELKALLDQYPEARPFVNDALVQGAWVGNCIGAMQQWDLGDPEFAKEILNGWVARWAGYPENYEALLEKARNAFIRGKPSKPAMKGEIVFSQGQK